MLQGMNAAHVRPCAQRIEEWKHKLVDLSRRNRLLFFRPGRTATLEILEPSAAEVFERLAIRAHEWRFWSPGAEEGVTPDGQAEALGLFASEPDREPIKAVESAHPPGAGGTSTRFQFPYDVGLTNLPAMCETQRTWFGY